jgi:hypothetical protein
MIASRQTKPYWSDAAIARAEREISAVPPPAAPRPELLRFLAEECDFKLEHADGSFMDHLTFCRDYCEQHYPQASSTPLFIHSILGVATNIFPMTLASLPKLQALLTADEVAHVEAFPAVLRIIQDYTLVDALRANLGRIKGGVLRGIRFHRCIDNQLIGLSASQLWVQLNYHLIHVRTRARARVYGHSVQLSTCVRACVCRPQLIDFLPVADWRANAPGLQAFASLHALLVDAGELGVRVEVSPMAPGVVGLVGGGGGGGGAPAHSSSTQPSPLAQLLAGGGGGGGGAHEAAMQRARKGAIAFTRERSAKIGHSLDFELLWATSSRL